MVAFYFRYLPGLLALFFTCAVYADNLPVVVVNPATNTGDFVSKNALSAIFGMRLRKWENGLPIKVHVLPDEHPLHVAFSKNVLRVFPYQLRNAWDRLVFSGTGEEPIRVVSEQQMLEAVSTTPGAIGYLSRSMIDDTAKVIPFK
jgi:ABC-type phosphate transport system substrate-binding protein